MTIPLTKIPARLEDLPGDVALTTPAHGDLLLRGASTWNNLPAGTDGAFLKAAGSGASPTYDNTFTWSAGQHVLKGHTRGTGGDRWNLQDGSGNDLVKVDTNGTLCHFPTSGTNVQTLQVNSLNPPFALGCVSISNGTGLGENFVVSGGHNVLGSGQTIDPTRGYARWAIEGHWWNASANGGRGDYQFEWHWACSFPDLGGVEIRPLSASCTWGTNGGKRQTGLAITGSLLSLQDEQGFEHIDYSWDGTTQVFRLIWNGTALTAADVWKVESTVTTDALNFGRSTQAATISYSSSGNVDQQFFHITTLTATHRHGATFFERFFGPTNTLHEFLQYTTVPTQWLAQDVAIGGNAGLFFGAAKLDVQAESDRVSGIFRQFSATQASDILTVAGPTGTRIAGFRAKGGLQLATLTDANATTGTIYFGSDHAGVPCWKDSGGTVHTFTTS